MGGGLVYTVMNLEVPYVVTFLSSCRTGGPSRRAQFHGVSQITVLLALCPSVS
jgi:hypothetical protein